MNEYTNMKYLEPMELLPSWAYIESEWDDIENQTVCIIDGIRYVKKEPKQRRIEEIEEFANELLL